MFCSVNCRASNVSASTTSSNVSVKRLALTLSSKLSSLGLVVSGMNVVASIASSDSSSSAQLLAISQARSAS